MPILLQVSFLLYTWNKFKIFVMLSIIFYRSCLIVFNRAFSLKSIQMPYKCLKIVSHYIIKLQKKKKTHVKEKTSPSISN